MDERLTAFEEKQARILDLLTTFISQKKIKDFYSVDEIAEITERTPYQVREWLRTGRLIGVKRAGGRGRHKEWAVSHDELNRYQNHGLRPIIRVAS